MKKKILCTVFGVVGLCLFGWSAILGIACIITAIVIFVEIINE